VTPTGRSDERPALKDEDIVRNLATCRQQVTPFFDFDRAQERIIEAGTRLRRCVVSSSSWGYRGIRREVRALSRRAVARSTGRVSRFMESLQERG
jgi:tyrosyl-tRNA synthetase